MVLPEKGGAFGVLEGSVRIVMLARDGRERELMQLPAGSFFCEPAAIGETGATTNLIAIALTACTIGYLSGASIAAAIGRDPSLILELMQKSAQNTSLLLKEFERIAFSDPLALVASILVERSTHEGDLHFSQERLAQIAGKTRVTVASALHRLQQRRAIRLERSHIAIIDRQHLRRIALGIE